MLWYLLLAIVVVSWVFLKVGWGDPSLLVRGFCWEEMQESLDDSPSAFFELFGFFF